MKDRFEIMFFMSISRNFHSALAVTMIIFHRVKREREKTKREKPTQMKDEERSVSKN